MTESFKFIFDDSNAESKITYVAEDGYTKTLEGPIAVQICELFKDFDSKIRKE